jgi:hypothetical protein
MDSAATPRFVKKRNGVTFTIAEDIQLMLKEQPGRLEYERILTATGALIELTLLGRLTSAEKPGFFVSPLDRLLAVVDSAPTGQPILDAALDILAARDKPWRCDRALLAIYRPVTTAVDESLAARGLVRAVGKPSGFTSGFLEITDDAVIEARRSILQRARTLPDTVTDPRLGAVIDVLRNGGDRFRGETGPHRHMADDWYPAEAAPTILGILRAETYLEASQ